MTFATIVVLLTMLARTAAHISHETAIGAVAINGGGIADLNDVCNAIIALDGMVCDPAVPAHIKENLPVYEVQADALRQQLTDLANANMQAFSPTAQEILKADIRYLADLTVDRKAR